MNGEGVVNTSEGKPGARAPNFPVEEEKMFIGSVEGDWIKYIQ